MSDSLLSLIDLVITVLIFLTIARSLFSWIDPTMRTPVGRILRDITEPIIAPIRQVVPTAGALDFSPMIAVFVLIILRQMLNTAFAS
jgi:YggT family protein